MHSNNITKLYHQYCSVEINVLFLNICEKEVMLSFLGSTWRNELHVEWASCLWVTEFLWHKKGVCKISSTTLGNGVSWGRGLHERTTEFSKMRARTRETAEWESREKREVGTHLGGQGNCKWKNPRSGLVEALGCCWVFSTQHCV